jgi:predicted nucleic acid-binding protein
VSATFVVDASVVVDFLVPGADSYDTERLIGGLRWAEPLTLMAPDLLFLEAANALRKMSLRRGISRAGADRAVRALELMPIASVPCSSVLGAAWSLWRNVSVYDAAYLGLAKNLDLPYVTRDRRAAEAGDRAGITAWHVGNPDLKRLLDSLQPPRSRSG